MIDKNMEHILAVHLNVNSSEIHSLESAVDKNGIPCVYVTLMRNPNAVCPYDNSRHVKSNGYYTRHIVISDRLFEDTTVYLKVPRYYCKDCHTSFSEDFQLAPAGKTISYETVIKVMDLLKSPHMTFREVAQLTGISASSVVRIFDEHCHIPRRTFPEAVCVDEVYSPGSNFKDRHLCFDEFKSVKKPKGHMSFIFMNADTGDVIDVLEDLKLNALIRYFNTYTRPARNAVETKCMDIYTPYMELVKAMFPNARIILDRFHIIQQLTRSLNRTRTAVMNRDKDNYRKFKRYWKLILKDEDDLNDSEFKSFICFNKLMRECDVVQYLVGLDPELQETYDLYQGLLHALKNKNPDRFFRICRTEAKGVSGFMKKSVKTLLKYEPYIRNALHYQWSNGVIEGTNNLIKVIKRIAFGYRPFVSFKVRILLIANTMVRFNNKRHGTFFCTMS